MRTWLGLIGGVALALLLPTSLFACTCVVSAGPGDSPLPPPRILSERPVVLVATVLWEDSGDDYEGPGKQRVVLFPEASWREPAPDTISLTVPSGYRCANYIAGGRYLIFADGIDDGTTSEGCYGAMTLAHPRAREELARLGPPSWIAPIPATSAVSELVGPEATPNGSEGLVQVSLIGFPPEVALVELAGDQFSSRPYARLELPPGVYAGRVHWRGGWTTHFYLGVRCEESTDRCTARRHLCGIDTSVVLHSPGDAALRF